MFINMIFTKKIVVSIIIGAFIYLSSTVLLNSSNKLAPNVISTTTTTTPTPLRLLLNQSQISHNSNVTIEKYDALKVHMLIMKEKIKKMTGNIVQPTIKKINYTVSNIHMLYSDKIRYFTKKKKLGQINGTNNENMDQILLMENLKMTRLMGAGVLVFPYPYIPIFPQMETSENMLNTLLKLAPEFNISITIAIKESFNRNILSIRRDIFHFIEAYKNHPSLYKYKKNGSSKSLPVIYIMDSYVIPSNKWKELLNDKGQLTIRNSDIDAIILGQFQDEEHNYHIRQSSFDGFFTCCLNNGESFGSTWKNWDSISVWSESHELMWSAGVNEGPGGVLSIKTALNTLLRCRSKPPFILINNIQFKDEYIYLIQSWIEMWSDVSLKNKFL